MTETLHPRPQMRRRDWTDLCGAWEFAHDDADEGLAAGWARGDRALPRQIMVPFPPESDRSGIGDKGFHPVVWYRRSFAAPDRRGRPAAAALRRRRLCRPGLGQRRACRRACGRAGALHRRHHRALRPEGPQVVVVRAEDQPGDVTQPRGKQDWQPSRTPSGTIAPPASGSRSGWSRSRLSISPTSTSFPTSPRCGCQVTVELAQPAAGGTRRRAPVPRRRDAGARFCGRRRRRRRGCSCTSRRWRTGRRGRPLLDAGNARRCSISRSP